jgi:hypothetical protein
MRSTVTEWAVSFKMFAPPISVNQLTDPLRAHPQTEAMGIE